MISKKLSVSVSVSGYPAKFTIQNYLYPTIRQILLSEIICIRLSGKFYFPCIPRGHYPTIYTIDKCFSNVKCIINGWFGHRLEQVTTRAIQVQLTIATPSNMYKCTYQLLHRDARIVQFAR